MASFADIQYCIYADILGRSEEVENFADVINGWSLIIIPIQIEKHLDNRSRIGIPTYKNLNWQIYLLFFSGSVFQLSV